MFDFLRMKPRTNPIRNTLSKPSQLYCGAWSDVKNRLESTIPNRGLKHAAGQQLLAQARDQSRNNSAEWIFCKFDQLFEAFGIGFRPTHAVP